MKKLESKIFKITPSFIDSLISNYYTFKFHLNYYKQMRKKYINPFNIYSTSPGIILYQKPSDVTFRARDSGKVVGGTWDLEAPSFSQNELYNSMKLRYNEGYEWEETPRYQDCKKRILSGESCWHGCESVKDLNKRCEYIDKLYQSINKEGYKRQCDLPEPSIRTKKIYPAAQREISVNIGRDGKLILIDGRHRLSIAKLLDLDSIPVHVSIVHKEWVGGLPDSLSESK